MYGWMDGWMDGWIVGVWMYVWIHVYGWLLVFYVMAASKSIQGWVPSWTVRTHGDLLVLTHWETRPTAL